MKDTFFNFLSTAVPTHEFNAIEGWLSGSDFFTAPASTKFHGCTEGVLLRHSLVVYELLGDKNKKYGLGLPDREVAVCGLLHDVCKIGIYHKEKRWRKVDGVWEDYYPWVVKDPCPLGHGEKSVILLLKRMKLTDNEIFLIRWHMGGFPVDPGVKGVSYTYRDAVKLFPAIVAMHTADYEASQLIKD